LGLNLLTPDWLTAVGTVGATVVALFLAAQSWLRALFLRPRLQIEVSASPPFLDTTKTDSGDRVHYYRLSVENKSGTIAEGVHIFVDAIDKCENGSYAPAPRFRPMFLRWTHIGNITMPALWKDMPRFCDLLHITNPTQKQNHGETLPDVPTHLGVLALDLEVKPNSMGHLLEPGAYRLKLKIAAANYRPREVAIAIEYDGMWELDTMSDHITTEKY
jgi:hypothetical protein